MSEESVQVGMIWPDAEESPVLRANQFLAQLNAGNEGPEELILVVGHISPPVILGTQEEQAAMLGMLGAVPVKTLGRFSLSRAQTRALAALLQRQTELWDQQGGIGA